MNRWQSTLMNNPRWGYGLIILLLLVMLPGTLRLKIDNALESWFLQDDPAFLAYETFKDAFGNDEVILLLLEDEKFTGSDQDYTSEIFNALNELPHLQTNITSLAETIPEQAVLLQQLPIGHLLERNHDDQHIAWLILEMMEQPDQDRHHLLAQIDSLENAMPGLTIYKAGYGVIYEEINRISIEESTLFIGLSYIIILGVAFLFMRNLRAVLVGGLGVILSLVVTLGVMGYAGWNINMVSMALPSLVFAVSIADVLHVFRVLKAHSSDSESFEDTDLLETLQGATRPCFYTSITTFFGFMSLLTAKIQVIREFGTSAALAVMIAFVVILLLVLPTLLRFMRPGIKPKESSRSAWDGPFRLIQTQRLPILVITSLFFVACIAGIGRLKVDTYSMGFLLPDNPVRQASEKIETDFGNYLPLDFTYTLTAEMKQDSSWQDALQEFESEVISQTVLSRGMSLSDLSGLDSTRAATIQATVPVFNSDDHLGRTMFRAPMVSALELTGIQSAVMGIAEKHLEPFTDYEFAGYMPLYGVMMDYILDGQLSSFGLAFIVISILLLFVYRSFKRLLISLIPNLFPVLGTLGLMGWLNISLDIATVTIAAIAIGIVVDDTVHFLHHYFHFLDKGYDSSRAILGTFKMTGSAIIATSTLLIAGLSVLLITSIYSVIYFGLLLIICILLALICDLMLLPAILMRPSKK